MKARYTISITALLGVMNLFTFVYAAQALNNTSAIQKKLDENPPKIVYVQAKDGKTPVKGVDYFDGASGINAMSYSVTNTIVKEMPLVGVSGERGSNGFNGSDGKNGIDGVDGVDGTNAPTQEIRVNKDNGNLENKLSDQKFWITLVPCSDYKTECP